MTDKLKLLYKKYEEIIAYVFFGGLTTLVNIVVFFVMNDIFHIHYLIANAAAWLASVLFAYVTNRTWVFKSKCRGAAAWTTEYRTSYQRRVHCSRLIRRIGKEAQRWRQSRLFR